MVKVIAALGIPAQIPYPRRRIIQPPQYCLSSRVSQTYGEKKFLLLDEQENTGVHTSFVVRRPVILDVPFVAFFSTSASDRLSSTAEKSSAFIGLLNDCFVAVCLRRAAPLVFMPGAFSTSFSSMASLLESLAFLIACRLRLSAKASSFALLNQCQYPYSRTRTNANVNGENNLLNPPSLGHPTPVAIFLLGLQSRDKSIESSDIKWLIKTILLSF